MYNILVVDDEEKMVFLERMCQLRWKHKAYFSEGEMLRPPVCLDPMPMFVTDSSMGMDEMLPAPEVVSCAWCCDGSRLLAFANTGVQERTLCFDCHGPVDPECDVQTYGEVDILKIDGSRLTLRMGGASALTMEM